MSRDVTYSFYFRVDSSPQRVIAICDNDPRSQLFLFSHVEITLDGAEREACNSVRSTADTSNTRSDTLSSLDRRNSYSYPRYLYNAFTSNI